MILYLDSSALVKRFVIEAGSPEVEAAIAEAAVAGTGIVSRAEIAAALAKAVRMGALTRDHAETALRKFRSQWPDFVRVQLTESVVARADRLAWEHNLRGYDSVHLASAILWQEAMDAPVTLATFDAHLWQAALEQGLEVFPATLPLRKP